MIISAEIFSIAVLTVIFGAIIGCYAWTASAVISLRKEMQCLEKMSAKEINGFSERISQISLQITNRLTRVETLIDGVLGDDPHE